MTVLLIFISVQGCLAQRYSQYKTESPDVGVFVGLSSYNGDLTYTPFQPKDYHPAIGVYYRMPLSPRAALRLGFSYGTVSGADSLAPKNSLWRLHRNLSFRSVLYDVHLYGELAPFRFHTGRYDYISPYLLAGFAIFHFDPMAEYEGNWYHLQPLGTEGQGLPQFPIRKPYKLTSFSIPLGGGIKYKNRTGWTLGAEIIYSKTYSDYIDDIGSTYVSREDILSGPGPDREIAADLADRSQELHITPRQPGSLRGNDSRTDSYLFSGITIGYTFHKKQKCFEF